MIRNLKALGLALMATMALGAVAATAAQAETKAHFTAAAGTTKITGHDETEVNEEFPHQTFTTDVGTIECEGTFEADAPESLTDDELTVDAEYNNCTPIPFVGAPVVNTHDCHFTFHAGTWDPEADASTGTADINCDTDVDGKKYIEVNVGSGTCVVKVPAQNGVGPIHYRNVETEGQETVTVEPTVGTEPDPETGEEGSPISYSWSGTPFLCGFTGSGSASNGTYHGPVTVEGEDEESNRTDITITDSETE
jgi:uncharacterized membrane protein